MTLLGCDGFDWKSSSGTRASTRDAAEWLFTAIRISLEIERISV